MTVIKKDFPQAKGWCITWKGGKYDSSTADKVQSIFSTVTGAVNSVHFLNSTSPGNTDNADMMLYFGDLKSTKSITSLTHKSGLKRTSFKLTGMKVADLEEAAKNNPANFTAVYSLAFDKAAEVKDDYKMGADLRVQDGSQSRPLRCYPDCLDESIIEVVVQK